MVKYRIEHDSMGDIKVDDNQYWGAQTERSLENFPIGTEKMPEAIVSAFQQLKKACAVVNEEKGKLNKERAEAIIQACDELLAGKFPGNFPLAVWQTGSGTQSNMNANEVIANRATEILSGDFRDKSKIPAEKKVHPNDHVNMGQSSNDTFPTALHIMAVVQTTNLLIPALKHPRAALEKKSEEFMPLIKSGRTHLQGATPITLGQEFSGYVSMLDHALTQIEMGVKMCSELALGGPAVGTGVNTPKDFGEKVCAQLSKQTGLHFVSAPNKFHSLTSKDAVVFLEGSLKALAANLMKIANDIRWLASGPRCGLGEITLPANEPGSSIMPGKVNPTQCEAVTMVAVQVMGNDAAIGFAASQGNFELNVFMPVIAQNLYQSIRLLADCMVSFADRCVIGITANTDKLNEYMTRSLMLVTALSPVIGYEKAAQVAKKALHDNTSLKEAVRELGYCSDEDFDKYVDPKKMIHPQ